MSLPTYNQVTSPEQNLLDLLAAQSSPNPPIGQEAFAVLAAKAILNLFAAASGGVTGEYLTKANSLSDVANPTQALANIGGMPRSAFVEALAALAGGIVVKRADGTAAVRTLVSGDGLSVANGDGNAGNPTVSVSPRLAQVNAASLQDLWGFVYRDFQVRGMSLIGASFGCAPLTIASGDKFEVFANTQCPFAAPINVDGELVIDGILYSV